MATDIGIDLGTANVLIYVQGKGIVLNEPSVVAIDTNTNKVLAVGSEAYRMVGRTPSNIRAIRPLKDGVISDFDVTQEMLSYFIGKLSVKGFMSKPNIMICAPTNITEIERKAIIQAAEQVGGGKVYLEYEPKVAAIGAGLDIFKPKGNMVIDMGGGTSDIAVLSLGDIVASRSVRLAGDKMNADISAYIKDHHGLIIGEHTAEQIKIQLGTALPVDEPKKMDVRGRDVATGMPKQITTDENEIESALHDTLQQIVKASISVLETVPPELASDIIDRGIMLTGGTSLLHGIDQLFSSHLKVPVVVSEDPLDNVAKGAGEMLERMQKNPSSTITDTDIEGDDDKGKKKHHWFSRK
ncbi:rod shape-determining protein [Limosilactobacillus sp.]|uniref:rod shape-determining protein n=1 Tax=Limosilactobacillus sp. TaxID=2773925 RepID=UPI00345E8CBC